MELIANQVNDSEIAICYITIFDEHVITNLQTLYGPEKAIAIILNGRKYDNKFQFVGNFEQLICRFEFHPSLGLLMKAYDFNNTLSDLYNESFTEYLKDNNLTEYINEIETAKTKQTNKLKCKIISPEEYFNAKFK